MKSEGVGTYFRKNCIELFFTGLMFIFFSMWAYIQPYNASPDEYMRYLIPWYIYETGELPTGFTEYIRNPIWGNSYGFTPILSYIFSAGFMKLTSLFSTDSFHLLLAARMVSVISGVGTVWISTRIARKILPKNCRWFFIIGVSMLPQAVFITSYVNNDAMAIFSTALIVYFWILGMERQWDWPVLLGMGVSVSLCALSYYNAYGFILCSIILFSLSILLFGKKKWQWSLWLKKSVIVILIVFALAGWWFIRSAVLYNGDFLGMETCNLCGEMYAQDGYKPSQIVTPQKQGISVIAMLANGWLLQVYKSFIGMFGYMSVALPAWMYIVYTLILVFAICGVIINLKKIFSFRNCFQSKEKVMFHWIMLIALIIPNIINIYYSYASDYQPQGRYSLPMLIPLGYFMTVGISYIGKHCFKNKVAEKFMYYVLNVTIVVVSLCSYFMVFAPTYRQ